MILGDFFTTQFVKFILAGGFAALVNFSVGISLAGMLPYHGDIVVGHLSGMVVAFFLFESKVFGRSSESRQVEVSTFIIVNIASIVQTWFVYIGLQGYVFPAIGMHFYPQVHARAIAIVIPVFTSFIAHKYLTFKH